MKKHELKDFDGYWVRGDCVLLDRFVIKNSAVLKDYVIKDAVIHNEVIIKNKAVLYDSFTMKL